MFAARSSEGWTPRNSYTVDNREQTGIQPLKRKKITTTKNLFFFFLEDFDKSRCSFLVYQTPFLEGKSSFNFNFKGLSVVLGLFCSFEVQMLPGKNSRPKKSRNQYS